MVSREMRDWLGAGDSGVGMMQYAVYAVCGVCSTRCMHYLVYAVSGVYSTQCILYLVLTLDHGMER
jgi:hypothetical protein